MNQYHFSQSINLKEKNHILFISISLILACNSGNATNLVNPEIVYDNEVQSNMAEAINVVCPQLGSLNLQGELSGNEQQLFFRCRDMVQTANEIVDDGSGTANSLGLSQSELGDAMGQLADEEVGVQGDWATRTSNEQLSNIQTRLSDIHSGSGGISLSGLQFQSTEENISFNELSPSQTGGSAGESLGPWGAFISGVYSTGDRDATERQTGFDLDSLGITAGVDYRFNNSLVGGVAIGYTDAEADYDNNGGSQDVNGYSFTVYSTYYIDSLYIDSSLSYGMYDYDSERNIVYASNTAIPGVNSKAKSSTDGDQFNVYIATGYTINQGVMDYTPYAQIRYLDVSIDGYAETGGANQEINMAVSDQSVDSLQTVFGGEAAYNVSTSWGVFVPYVRADWHHEFKNDSRKLSYQYVFDPLNTTYTLNTDEPDEDFFTIGLGFSTVYRSGQAYFDIESPVGLDNVDNTIFTLGARFAF